MRFVVFELQVELKTLKRAQSTCRGEKQSLLDKYGDIPIPLGATWEPAGGATDHFELLQ
jgi:hypothetical protein